MQSIRESELTAASLREAQEAGERRVEQLRALHADEVAMIEDQARQRMESTQSSYSNLMATAQEKLHHLRIRQSSLVAQMAAGSQSRQASMDRPHVASLPMASTRIDSDLYHVRKERDQNFSVNDLDLSMRGTVPLPMMPLPRAITTQGQGPSGNTHSIHRY